MIPQKFANFLQDIYQKTQDGKITWYYDDDRDYVELAHKDFHLKIVKAFDYDAELVIFNIYYFDSNHNKQYQFLTNELYTDFNFIRMLYQVAQASDWNPPHF